MNPAPRNYMILVRSAFLASMTVLAVKVAAVLLLANFESAPIEVRFFVGFLPYLSIQVTGISFATIVTGSTIAAAFVAAFLLFRPAFQGGWPRQTVWGRLVGLTIVAETLAFESWRHLSAPPVVRTGWLWVIIVPFAAGLGLFVVALRTSSSREHQVEAVLEAEPVTSPAGTRQ